LSSKEKIQQNNPMRMRGVVLRSFREAIAVIGEGEEKGGSCGDAEKKPPFIKRRCCFVVGGGRGVGGIVTLRKRWLPFRAKGTPWGVKKKNHDRICMGGGRVMSW